MQLFSDYHLHPQGHRLQPYSQQLLQPWADHAREIGLRDFALTDHDRYHQGVDFDQIERFRETNPDLKIRAGIELDNDPVTLRPAAPGWKGIGTGSISSSVPSISCRVTGHSIMRARKPSLPGATSTGLCRLLRTDS